MSLRALSVLVLLIVTVLAGCKEGSQEPGRVAVIDLERVARGIGRDIVIRQSLEARQREAEAQLGQFREQLQNRVNEETGKAGESPTTQQATAIRNLQNQVEAQFAAAQQQVGQMMGQTQLQLINEFREQIGPVAIDVAARHGMTIVLVRTEVMLAADPAVDITEEVIEELKKEGLGGSLLPPEGLGGFPQARPGQSPLLPPLPPPSARPTTPPRSDAGLQSAPATPPVRPVPPVPPATVPAERE